MAAHTHTAHSYIRGHLHRGHGRLVTTTDYRAFVQILRQCLDECRTELLVYCLMPDSWHLIVGHRRGTMSPHSLAGRVVATRTQRAEHHFPERRLFDPPPVVELIGAGQALVGRCIEIKRLALVAGWVKQVQEWPWCSATDRFRMFARLPLAPRTFLGSQAWVDHLNQRPPARVGRASDVRAGDFANDPGRLPLGAQLLNQARRRSGGAHENQPHAHVERPEHLLLWNAAGIL